MSFSVNTNNNAMAALRTLNQTNREMSQVQSRINSGLAVGSAKDNASTFAIAQGMRGDISGLKAVQGALQLGETTVNVASKAAESISNKLIEMKNKIVEGQAKNLDREAIQQDIDSFVKQIEAIGEAAQFNGVNLLQGALSKDLDVVSSLNRTAASGPGAVSVATTTINAQDLTTGGTGLNISGLNVTGEDYVSLAFAKDADIQHDDKFAFTDDAGVTHHFIINDGSAAPTIPVQDPDNRVHLVDIDNAADSTLTRVDKLAKAIGDAGFTATIDLAAGKLNITGNGPLTLDSGNTGFTTGVVAADETGGNPATAVTRIEAAIDAAKLSVAYLGTKSNELSTQKDFVKSLSDSLTSGVGSLVDADLAEESARQQALQTKQQLGIQALSIANQGPSAVLSLFR